MRTASVLADILRVDHAGETGAVYIYRTQRWVSRWRSPGLRGHLTDLHDDERRHRDIFRAAMTARGIRPCAMLPLWWSGGILLGLITAMLGTRAIHGCTEAVERTVHRHMDDQVAWLDSVDEALAANIALIRDEEVAHLEAARYAQAPERPLWLALLDAGVAAATEMLVWLSTYGASSRMHCLRRTT